MYLTIHYIHNNCRALLFALIFQPHSFLFNANNGAIFKSPSSRGAAVSLVTIGSGRLELEWTLSD
jgi:hypothetical protein